MSTAMQTELAAKNWRGLIRPKNLDYRTETSEIGYGIFVCEPLERGFGTTIGNSLRRVLLSSLQGSAVTAVKVEGAVHEFSTVPGVAEDVTDILLNVKEILLSQNVPGRRVLTIEKHGEGAVTAADIVTDGTVEILNPDHHIATLSERGSFKMELYVEMGRGYVPAEGNRRDDLPVGVIPIDSLFAPVRKVNYTVANARVGQRTDYDKLTIEIWTDGSITPEDAMGFSAKILRDQLRLFINFDEQPEPSYQERQDDGSSVLFSKLNRTVDELELSVRSANCLQNADIRFIGQLVRRSESEMLKTKNFGRKSLKEIKEILTTMGLGLGMSIEGWTAPLELGAPTELGSVDPAASVRGEN